MNTLDNIRVGFRVYYKFDSKHPYEHQAQGDRVWGKGIVAGFISGGLVVVSNSNHDGSLDRPWMIFEKKDLKSVCERFKGGRENEQ